MPIPQFDTTNPKMISQGPSVCIFNKADSGEVLASWLFAQYLLTNNVQIAYAQTEGYVPVTKKAQESTEYQDYLARSGEDNSLYYSIKIDATRMLLNNVNHTFVTPVFNGSTSLRDAAGQLIENTVKPFRRKETVDDTYIEQLYQNIASLYRLDQTDRTQTSVGKTEFGKLPGTSVFLLVSLAAAWFFIVLYIIFQAVKRKRQNL